jgi:type IX secretion system PorP/SprF family membrane protein
MNKFLFIISVSFTIQVWSQQDIQLSQSITNPYLFNPAAGGTMNVGEIVVGTRSQWLGIEGGPRTQFASIQSQLKGKKRFILDELTGAGKTFYSTPQRTLGSKQIVGATFVKDQIGPFTKTSFKGSFAVHLPISNKFNAGIGIGLGWSNFSLDESKVSLGTANDNAYLNYLGGKARQNFVDVTAGFVAYNNRFFISLSSSQFLNNRTSFNSVQTESNYTRHYYLLGSYRFDLTPNYGIEPVLVVKQTNGAPFNWEIGTRLHYQRLGFVSIAYRHQSALAMGLGINLKQHFRVIYAYDWNIAGTQQFGAGAHELQLGYIFGHRRNMEKEFKKDEQPVIETPVEN